MPNPNKPKTKTSNGKIILRSDREAKRRTRNTKLDNHINEGVADFARGVYEDSKEARRNARWYQAGEAIKDAKLRGQHDADVEFAEEFSAWADKQQEDFYAELDAEEQALLECEDDVIDVEFKPLAPSRPRRRSKLGGSNTTPQIEGSDRKRKNKYDVTDTAS